MCICVRVMRTKVHNGNAGVTLNLQVRAVMRVSAFTYVCMRTKVHNGNARVTLNLQACSTDDRVHHDVNALHLREGKNDCSSRV